MKVLEKSTLFCTFRNRIESRKKTKTSLLPRCAMPRSSVLWRSGSFSRTSFFSVSSLVFFRFIFVAGRAAGAPRNHCGARRDDGETPGAGLKRFSFPVNPKPFVILYSWNVIA